MRSDREKGVDCAHMLLQADPDAPPGLHPPPPLLGLPHQPARHPIHSISSWWLLRFWLRPRRTTHSHPNAHARRGHEQNTNQCTPLSGWMVCNAALLKSLQTVIHRPCLNVSGDSRRGVQVTGPQGACLLFSLCRLGTSMTSTAYCCALTAMISSPSRVLTTLRNSTLGLPMITRLSASCLVCHHLCTLSRPAPKATCSTCLLQCRGKVCRRTAWHAYGSLHVVGIFYVQSLQMPDQLDEH